MRVACVQIEGRDLADAEAGLQRALAMIDEAAEGGADLVVLPECSFPAYFLRGRDDYARAPLRPWAEVVALVGGKARQHACHVVAGLVQPDESGALLNAAVLFGPDGAIAGSAAKSFLWHFDRHWFTKGERYPVFDTALGKIGLMVCADGRMPEIARILALRGAQVIVDPTALVTGGGDRVALSNPQIDYMLPMRAMENGVWIVVANKVGLEADTILYCGRSCVIDPQGHKVAVGSSDREEVVFGDIALSDTPLMPVTRAPGAYGMLTKPMEDQPIARLLHEPLVLEETVVRVAAVQLFARASSEDYLARVEELLDTLSRQDVDLAVLPGILPEGAEGDAAWSSEAMSRLAELSGRFGLGIVAALTEREGSDKYRTCFIWDAGEVAARYRKVHQGGRGYSAGLDLPVFETRFGRLGIMLDDEGLLPEVPRCLMLKGADLIVWPARSSRWPLRRVARARADENKVYVVLATAVGGGTALVNPGGTAIAAGLPDAEQAISAQVVWASSRYKEMAPGTHVVWGRLPQFYDAIVH